MRGSGCATASSASVIGRSSSYVTAIRSSAAVATSSLPAATAATGSPTKRTLSSASACSSWLTGRMPNGIGRSWPVSTAFTPGNVRARDVSMAVMRAWGWGLRSSLADRRRGRNRSSENLGTAVHRVELPAHRHPLDGLHAPPGAREAEHEAGEDRLAVHQHGAGTALAQLTAVLRAGEPEVLAQHFKQRLVRREGDLDRLAVQIEADLNFGVGHLWKPNLDNRQERRQLSGRKARERWKNGTPQRCDG